MEIKTVYKIIVPPSGYIETYEESEALASGLEYITLEREVMTAEELKAKLDADILAAEENNTQETE